MKNQVEKGEYVLAYLHASSAWELHAKARRLLKFTFRLESRVLLQSHACLKTSPSKQLTSVCRAFAGWLLDVEGLFLCRLL